jgi:hemerythrin-like domain-containing protein
MSHPILDRLQSDHQELSRFLYSFRLYMQQLIDPSSSSDIALILNMLDFINVYPENFHHPVEDVIFAHLMTKSNIDLTDVTFIMNQHQQLEAETREIREDFQTLSFSSRGSLDRFFDDVMVYIDEQNAHLFLEESSVFPLIEDVFSEDDWLTVEGLIDQHFPGDHWEEFQSEIDQMITDIERVLVSGDYRDLQAPIDVQRDY